MRIRRLSVSLLALTLVFSGETDLYASASLTGLPSPSAGLDPVAFPAEAGHVLEIFQGKDPARSVILIQDAHASADAQRNIRKWIDYLQAKAGAGIVGAEGASLPLDPQLFKSFPRRELLRGVLDELLEKGELTGVSAAALLNRHEALYTGIEDLELYQNGLSFYLQAAGAKDRLLALAGDSALRLKEAKERAYSPELLKIDHALEGFAAKEIDLAECLQTLAEVLPPPGDSPLAKILEESRMTSGSSLEFELEVKRLAQKASSSIKAAKTKELLMEFRRKEQAFLTSALSAAEFADYLLSLGLPGFGPGEFSPGLRDAADRQRRLREIKGTEFYEAFEAYAGRVKETLFRDEDERRLDGISRYLYLAVKLTRLELTRGEWMEWNESRSLEGAGDFIAFNAEKDFVPHEAFYQNASAREEGMIKRILQLLRTGGRGKSAPRDCECEGIPAGPGSVIAAAGGFHTDGLKKQLRENGISYAVIMPRIQTLPPKDLYEKQMRGEVSWSPYFRAEDGKIDLYKAFARALRDRLLEAEKDAKGELIKEWRDQIIRDLAAQGRVREAANYTSYLDELVQGSLSDESAARISRIETFIGRLSELRENGRLDENAVLNLFRPQARIVDALAAQLVPRSFLRLDHFPPGSAAYSAPQETGSAAFSRGPAELSRSELRSEEMLRRKKEEIFGENFDRWTTGQAAPANPRLAEDAARALAQDEDFLAVLESPDAETYDMLRIAAAKGYRFGTAKLRKIVEAVNAEIKPSGKQFSIVQISLGAYADFITALKLPPVQAYLDSDAFDQVPGRDKLEHLLAYLRREGFYSRDDSSKMLLTALPLKPSPRVHRKMFGKQRGSSEEKKIDLAFLGAKKEIMEFAGKIGGGTSADDPRYDEGRPPFSAESFTVSAGSKGRLILASKYEKGKPVLKVEVQESPFPKGTPVRVTKEIWKYPSAPHKKQWLVRFTEILPEGAEPDREPRSYAYRFSAPRGTLHKVETSPGRALVLYVEEGRHLKNDPAYSPVPEPFSIAADARGHLYFGTTSRDEVVYTTLSRLEKGHRVDVSARFVGGEWRIAIETHAPVYGYRTMYFRFLPSGHLSPLRKYYIYADSEAQEMYPYIALGRFGSTAAAMTAEIENWPPFIQHVLANRILIKHLAATGRIDYLAEPVIYFGAGPSIGHRAWLLFVPMLLRMYGIKYGRGIDLDILRGMLEESRRRFEAEGVPEDLRPIPLVHDMTKRLPYADGSVKRVENASLRFVYPKMRAKVIDEMYRVLEDGGVASIMTNSAKIPDEFVRSFENSGFAVEILPAPLVFDEDEERRLQDLVRAGQMSPEAREELRRKVSARGWLLVGRKDPSKRRAGPREFRFEPVTERKKGPGREKDPDAVVIPPKEVPGFTDALSGGRGAAFAETLFAGGMPESAPGDRASRRKIKRTVTRLSDEIGRLPAARTDEMHLLLKENIASRIRNLNWMLAGHSGSGAEKAAWVRQALRRRAAVKEYFDSNAVPEGPFVQLLRGVLSEDTGETERPEPPDEPGNLSELRAAAHSVAGVVNGREKTDGADLSRLAKETAEIAASGDFDVFIDELRTAEVPEIPGTAALDGEARYIPEENFEAAVTDLLAFLNDYLDARYRGKKFPLILQIPKAAARDKTLVNDYLPHIASLHDRLIGLRTQGAVQGEAEAELLKLYRKFGWTPAPISSLEKLRPLEQDTRTLPVVVAGSGQIDSTGNPFLFFVGLKNEKVKDPRSRTYAGLVQTVFAIIASADGLDHTRLRHSPELKAELLKQLDFFRTAGSGMIQFTLDGHALISPSAAESFLLNYQKTLVVDRSA